MTPMQVSLMLPPKTIYLTVSQDVVTVSADQLLDHDTVMHLYVHSYIPLFRFLISTRVASKVAIREFLSISQNTLQPSLVSCW